MTEKLFYKDSHMQMFQAIVQECCKDGENYKIRLDRTAFFPEGGGQYADILYPGLCMQNLDITM